MNSFEVGEKVALYYQGIYRVATVQRVSERFVWSEGICFNLSKGREVNTVMPTYIHKWTPEIQDWFDRHGALRRLYGTRFNHLTTDELRRVVALLDAIEQERKHGG